MQIQKHITDKPHGKKSFFFNQNKMKFQARLISFLPFTKLYCVLIHLQYYARKKPIHTSSTSRQHSVILADSPWNTEESHCWMSVCVLEKIKCVMNKMSFHHQPTLCAIGFSHDRCLCTGSVQHQHHTGVLIRHYNYSIGGVVTDIWNQRVLTSTGLPSHCALSDSHRKAVREIWGDKAAGTEKKKKPSYREKSKLSKRCCCSCQKGKVYSNRNENVKHSARELWHMKNDIPDPGDNV